jgi:hypothetical protein
MSCADRLNADAQAVNACSVKHLICCVERWCPPTARCIFFREPFGRMLALGECLSKSTRCPRGSTRRPRAARFSTRNVGQQDSPILRVFAVAPAGCRCGASPSSRACSGSSASHHDASRAPTPRRYGCIRAFRRAGARGVHHAKRGIERSLPTLVTRADRKRSRPSCLVAHRRMERTS